MNKVRLTARGAEKLREELNNLKSVERPRIIDAIAEARPDILFAAMSSPKKELFLAKWNAHLNVPVCHGVGGAFDVMAGKAVRAPEAWQRFGMEWLYRLLQEPRRLWRRYLVTNTVFCGMVLAEMFGRGKPGPATAPARESRVG